MPAIRKEIAAGARGLRTGLQHEIEGSLRRTPETRKPSCHDDLTQLRFSSLRAKAETYLLRSGARSTQKRGSRVVDPPDGVEIVVQLVSRKGFYNHPSSVWLKRPADVS